MCSITRVNPSIPCQPELLNLNSAKYVHTTIALKGFPGGSDGGRCLQWGRPRVDPWAEKISWRREWLLTPVLLPGDFHGQKSLASYSPWGLKESDTTE